MLLHSSIQVYQLSDFPINLSLMVIVIGESVMNFSRTELGKFAQDFLNRPSSSVVLYDGTDGEPTPFNDRVSSLHIGTPFNVGMLSDCGSGLSSHKNPHSLNYVIHVYRETRSFHFFGEIKVPSLTVIHWNINDTMNI